MFHPCVSLLMAQLKASDTFFVYCHVKTFFDSGVGKEEYKKRDKRYRVLFPVNVYCVILHNVPGIWLGWADAVEGVC